MAEKILDSAFKKVTHINQAGDYYGTFAEIGAGQETSRFFYKETGSSHTVAKSISAYDMTVSTDIYGECDRYVSKDRLKQILKHEGDLLEKRCQDKKALFVFANTVSMSTKNHSRGHGWLGVAVKKEREESWSYFYLHVRLNSTSRHYQQKLLGTLGINLLYGVFYFSHSSDTFLSSLSDDIILDDLRIDYLDAGGDLFKEWDSRLANIYLIKNGYCSAMMFDSSSQHALIQDHVFEKNILLMTDFSKPVTKQHLDIMRSGEQQWKSQVQVKDDFTAFQVPVSTDKSDSKNELLCVDMLTALGYRVLLTSFDQIYDLKTYLRKMTEKNITFVVGASFLDKIFSKAHKKNPYHLYSATGRLFDHKTCIYIYPHKDDNLCLTASSFHPVKPLSYIYDFLRDQKAIMDISNCDEANLSVMGEKVSKLFSEKNPKWRDYVPKEVQKIIDDRKLNFI